MTKESSGQEGRMLRDGDYAVGVSIWGGPGGPVGGSVALVAPLQIFPHRGVGTSQILI
jgi:hypothetical protein